MIVYRHIKELFMSLFSSILWPNVKMHIVRRGVISSYRGRIGSMGVLIVLCVALAACSLHGGNVATSTPDSTASTDVALARLRWCGAPSEVFRDQASSQSGENVSTTQLGPANGTPRAVTDWNIVKANLGFTLYLPRTMPAGTCLLSAASSLRDPVFGSNFTITYILSNHDPISFSLAPIRNQHISAFQCSVSQDSTNHSASGTPGVKATATAKSNQSPLQICTGVQGKTSIVFSAHGQTSQLQQVFQSMQPNVDWVPTK
jgi:hypothetical protein